MPFSAKLRTSFEMSTADKATFKSGLAERIVPEDRIDLGSYTASQHGNSQNRAVGFLLGPAPHQFKRRTIP